MKWRIEMLPNEEIEADFRQVFYSIWVRINDNRQKTERVTLLDSEVDKAVKEYCKEYPKDFVGMRGGLL